MPEQGWKSYLIGTIEQTAFATQSTSTSCVIHHIAAGGFDVGAEAPPVIPVRTQRNPSAIRGVQGPIRPRGTHNIQCHAKWMTWWYQQLFQAATISSSEFNNGVWLSILAQTEASSQHSADTQPNATTPAADPALLAAHFESTVTGAVAVTGTDGNGETLVDTITFSGTTDGRTTKQFQTIAANGITLNNSALTSTETLTIKAHKGITLYDLNLGDGPLDGFTWEVVRGTLADVIVGAVVNTATLNIAETINLSLGEVLAYNELTDQRIDGQANTITDVTGWDEVSETVFPGWSMAVTIDASTMQANAISLDLANGFDFVDRQTGSRLPQAIENTGLRDIRFRAGIEYDSSTQEFRDKARNNDVVAVTAVALWIPAGGPEYSMTWTMGRCQFMDVPRVPVDGPANLIMPIELQAIRTASATSSDEVTLQVQSDQDAITDPTW